MKQSVWSSLGVVAVSLLLSSCGGSDVPPSAAVVAGWTTGDVAKRNYVVRLDRDAGRGGREVVVLESEEPRAPFAAISRTLPAAGYRGKRVRFSALVRTDAVDRGAALWMRVDGKEAPLAFDNMEKRPLTGTRAWKRHEVVLDVPMAAEQIVYGALMKGKGALRLDEAALEPVAGSVPVTGGALPSPAAAAEGCACDAKS